MPGGSRSPVDFDKFKTKSSGSPEDKRGKYEVSAVQKQVLGGGEEFSARFVLQQEKFRALGRLISSPSASEQRPIVQVQGYEQPQELALINLMAESDVFERPESRSCTSCCSCE